MRLSFVPFLTFLVIGCGRDEILERAEEAAGASDAAPEAQSASAAGPSTAGGAGLPAEPSPGMPNGGAGQPPGDARNPDGTGIPEAPSPAPPGTPGGGSGSPGGGDVRQPDVARRADGTGIPVEPKPGDPLAATGPSVVISGVVAFSGYKGGTVRITAFDGDHSARGAKPPKVLGMVEIPKPGAYTLRLPANAGKAWIEATVDEDGNGRPGPLDPQGPAERFPVTVVEAPIDDLDISVQRRAPPDGAGIDAF